MSRLTYQNKVRNKKMDNVYWIPFALITLLIFFWAVFAYLDHLNERREAEKKAEEKAEKIRREKRDCEERERLMKEDIERAFYRIFGFEKKELVNSHRKIDALIRLAILARHLEEGTDKAMSHSRGFDESMYRQYQQSLALAQFAYDRALKELELVDAGFVRKLPHWTVLAEKSRYISNGGAAKFYEEL